MPHTHEEAAPCPLDLIVASRLSLHFAWQKGGGTRFADLDAVVPAIAGNAVLWPSVMNTNPQRDEPYTNHEGMPPDVGVKYASNVWIHQYDYRTPAAKNCLLTHKNTH